MTTSLRQGRPKRKPGVWVRTAGAENAVFNPDAGSLHLLNHTALAIWDLCDGDTWPDEMIGAICDVSGLHPDVVAEDVQRILGEFDRAGLLEWAE
jgi:Coenzyme PQQ synthesis protein D (PqqD)